MTSSQTSIAAIAALAIIGAIVGGVWMLMQTPVDSTQEIPADIDAQIKAKADLIVVQKPVPLATVSSPLTVRGMARGTWFFEASFPFVLVDWNGKIIAQSYATAVLDPQDPDATWMTEDFVPFEGTIEFMNPSDPNTPADHFSRRGTLILQRDNPSGLPEHDDALEIPVQFN